MIFAAWIAIALGVALSLYLLQNDFRAARSAVPYGGKRFGPELHVVAAALSGAGVGALLGLWPGVGIGVAHGVLGFVLALFLYRA